VRRVVSLVPSLTESVEVTAPGLLVGATDWCSHPAGLDVVRIGGTKNPDVAAVLDLAPDVVVANAEENREVDLAAIRGQGVAVWVTAPETVDAALVSLHRMLTVALGLDRPQWMVEAAEAWREPPPPASVRAAIPIWRRPWMWLGRNTFAGDVLARLGVVNVLAGHAERYPKLDPAELPAHELVVLPDEPYAFSATDGPEVFAARTALVSGRHLTWYGPSLVQARAVLAGQLYR
jgi:ABC-type Fe3+-hydroxamate transport system substrate-binding protein